MSVEKLKMQALEFVTLTSDESGKYGTDNIKKLFIFVLGLTRVVKEVTDDGKVKFLEYLKFIPSVIALGELYAKFPEIWKELIDMDEAEADEFRAWVMVTYGVPADQVEEVIEKVFATITNMAAIWAI